MPSSPLRGQTGTPLKIQLPSAIFRAGWTAPWVAQGGEVGVEILLQFVADGSDVKVTVRDDQGKSMTTLSGKTVAGLYRTRFKVPKTSSKTLVYHCELPAHKLQATSTAISLLPYIEVAKAESFDSHGNALQEISDQTSVTSRWKIHGALPGARVDISILCRVPEVGDLPVWTESVAIDQLRAEVAWQPSIPRDERIVPDAKRTEPTGEKYVAPEFRLSASCGGIVSEIAVLPYVSWVEFDLGGTRGELDLLYPDGTEETRQIPDNGIVRVKGQKAGTIRIEEIRASE